jgi:acyl-coenzyme A synthetase/AMP-(fatty) acid ligase
MMAALSESFNLVDHFVDRHVREGRGSKIAIRCGDCSHTYAGIAQDVNRAAHGLLSLGLATRGARFVAAPA